MSYTISRNVKLLKIRSERVTPNLTTKDFQRGDMVKESYTVRVAEFSNGASGTVAQIESYLDPPNNLSVAINEFKQVIAIKNHVTGKKGSIYGKTSAKIKDLLAALIYIIPIIAFGSWLSWKSIPFLQAGDGKGFIPLTFGIGALALGVFITKGYLKLDLETKQALRDLD